MKLFIPDVYRAHSISTDTRKYLLDEVFQGIFEDIRVSTGDASVDLPQDSFAELCEFLRSDNETIPPEWTPSGLPRIASPPDGARFMTQIEAIAPVPLPETQRGAMLAQAASILLSGGEGLEIDVRCFLPDPLAPVAGDVLPDTVRECIDDTGSFGYAFYNALVPVAAAFHDLSFRSCTRLPGGPGVYAAALVPEGMPTGTGWYITNTGREAALAEAPTETFRVSASEGQVLFRDRLTDDIVLPFREPGGALSIELEAHETLLLVREPI